MIKDFEIEELQDGWEIVSIEEDADLISGLRPKGGATDEGVPSLGGEHITSDGHIKFSDKNARYVPKEFFKSVGYKRVEDNDILINKDGANTGKLAILKEKFSPNITINEHVFVLRSRKIFDQKYLFYWMFSYLGQRQIKERITGSAQPGLSSRFTKDFIVLKPPFHEQQKIAEILETVDNAIDKTDALIKKYKRLKQGLMQKLLTRGIDENGHIRSEKTHKFKDSPLGRIPEEWEVTKLGEVIELFDNKRIPLDSEYRSTIKGTIPYCGANGIIDYINDYIFDEEYVLIAEDGGDFSRYAETAYIMRGKFWANNHVHIVKGKNRVLDNYFLMFCINIQDVNSYISGTTRGKLNQRLLKSILNPLPPFPEQHRITTILSRVGEVIEKEEAYKAKLERIKRGLMEDLLTGRVRVNDL